MKKTIAKLSKTLVIAIFLAVQVLPANPSFAGLPVADTYIPSLSYPEKSPDIAASFSIKNTEENRFNIIDKALAALARREIAIYGEYLSLTDKARSAPEALQKLYAGKMRKTSQNSMNHLRKILAFSAGESSQTPALISENRHTFKALFLLDRKSINLR